MAKGFRVTYEIVTYESAEHGEAEEHGFVMPGGWNVDIETAMADKEGEYSMTLREAIELVGCLQNEGGYSFYETDGRTDYHNGAEERRALHLPKSISEASRKRIVRILKKERLL